MRVEAVRGAIQVDRNEKGSIEAAAVELVQAMARENSIRTPAIVSVLFSQTRDLDAGNPATGVRLAGFDHTPLFCTQEPEYPGSLPRTLRVLMTVQRPDGTGGTDAPLKPVYLGGAQTLRPDLAQ